MLRRLARFEYHPPRERLPAPAYTILLAVVFVAALVAAYLFVRPINDDDWVRLAQFLRYMLRLQNPYDLDLGMHDADLRAYGIEYGYVPYSPWIAFYFGIFAYATTRFAIALLIATWITIILDDGYPQALLLILHPAFIMLWASGNIEFFVSGVGLWLIWRGVRGWRRGVALMLLAIKPYALPLLLVLEGVRLLWERDWRALATMAAIFLVAVALYPGWMTDVIPSFFNIARSKSYAEANNLPAYPFSVFGAWGVLPALGVTLIILVLMRKRLSEFRTLAVLLSLVWTPFNHPYSYAVLLLLFRRSSWWRVLLYLGLGLATLPFLFQEYHHLERYGVLVFLLLAALLSSPDPDQTEQAIAARRHQPVFPPVRWLVPRGLPAVDR
ncbi:MAG TPA: glycosyltransferase family 87 protein [Aggregatilinea sp.]|jgi:hypothetical protein|uniref:glycosyltransferase family 87 protein n=1 Tax=Aggregatilinea sp. TaxID=2806333 RepID=UPI002C6819FB|nr:glycosyltransferase family 87 protein [Aggregatilinea sp.]HML23399.1 glycosyltransferase family 87 protein [Aggregatilinea sp.]